MIATTKPLRDAFARVSKLATGRTILPVLSSAHISAKGGVCSISCTNLDTYAAARCGAVGDLPDVCVPAFAFAALLAAADDEVKLEPVEGNRLKAKSKSSAVLACQDAKDFPVLGQSGLKATGLNCADLADAIEAVAWAVGDQIDRPLISGINVVTTAKSMATMATNGALVGWKETLGIAAKSEWLLRGDASPLFVMALREDGAVLHLSEKHALVKSEWLDVGVRLMEGKFYDVRTAIVNQKRQTIGTINRQEWLDTLGTIQLLAKDDPMGFAPTLFQFESGGAAVTYNGVNTFTREMSGPYPEARFMCDAKLFSKALESCEETVTLSTSGNNLCLNCGDYQAFVALLQEKREK